MWTIVNQNARGKMQENSLRISPAILFDLSRVLCHKCAMKGGESENEAATKDVHRPRAGRPRRAPMAGGFGGNPPGKHERGYTLPYCGGGA
jgi:hypothetical protein